MPHPHSFYGDPFSLLAHQETIAEKQHLACGNCVYQMSMPWQGKTIYRCELKHHQYGKRCWEYQAIKKKSVL